MTTYQIDVNEGMNKSLADLVAPWRPEPLKNYCISNTNLIDVVSGVSLPGAYIFIEQGIISKVEFGSEKPVTVDEVAFEIIDGTGKYVTPGLIDSHVHIASVAGEADLTKLMLMPKSVALLRIRYTLEAALARGFTTVRDCGGAEGFLKAEIRQGSLNGPRLITCGHAISQTGGHGDLRSGALPASAFDSCSCHFGQVGVVADGVPECYKAAREEFRRGADFIKIMGGGGVASPTDKISNKQFCDDEIKALVDVANSYHTYVTAHAYTAEAIQNCIKLGVKGIEHGNLLDERTAELMAELGCYLTPTLVTYKVMGPDQFSAFLGPENSRKNTEVLYKGIDAMKIAQKKKVKICFGSDLLGPLYGYQTQEFRIRGKVQSAQEILLSATVTPAEMNGLGDKLGQIKPGFIADLLMMKSNPLDDITILDEPESNILFVMKEGRIY
ncbi:AAR_G0028180.mRNA.1.CDS.1 [Saccharomyces cerevisiae]|nr:BDF_1d_G0027920.mRNA.1.CDS.1 [Saccharomyces cerevisiae]CAI4531809.1 BDC_1c_G0027960.mRNA.1.CDS.1 [Saccharomyces cerevisiae]CAI4542262.1 AAR_G0028180.mRNA.1.CDS.1 [Saccharomyces cerevisiae]CAI4977861.1 BBT_HP_G0063940.mRNA.1.CDS.1 [Saccharomyces cerevisiae]CAI4992218.1 BBT_HP_G0073340.mRNA.1.CDS.1 [Saccharomyces cerevisiae]